MAVIALVGAPVAAGASSSSFRLAGIEIHGANVKVKIAYDQDGQAQIDFFAHAQRPKHRNVDVPGPAIRSGLLLGTAKPRPGTGMCEFTVSLEQLAKIGITPGRTLYVGANWPGSGGNGGHEWGVNAGVSNPEYCNSTDAILPAAVKNSRLAQLLRGQDGRGRQLSLRPTGGELPLPPPGGALCHRPSRGALRLTFPPRGLPFDRRR